MKYEIIKFFEAQEGFKKLKGMKYSTPIPISWVERDGYKTIKIYGEINVTDKFITCPNPEPNQ